MPDGRATVHGVGVLCVPGPHHTAFTEYRSAGAVSRLSPRGDLAHRPKSFARRTRRSFSPDRVSGSSRPGQPVLLAPRGRPAMRDVLRCGGHFASPRSPPRTSTASPRLAAPRRAARAPPHHAARPADRLAAPRRPAGTASSHHAARAPPRHATPRGHPSPHRTARAASPLRAWRTTASPHRAPPRHTAPRARTTSRRLAPATPCAPARRLASRGCPGVTPRACIALRYASRGRVCVGRVPAANKPASPYAFGAASTRRRRSAIRPVPATRVRLAATPSPGCSKPAPWSAGRPACASRPRQVPGVTSACRSPASRRRSGPRRPGRHRGPSGCS